MWLIAKLKTVSVKSQANICPRRETSHTPLLMHEMVYVILLLTILGISHMAIMTQGSDNISLPQ